MGVDPAALTLRELLLMATGRARRQWDETATICAVVANCQPIAKRRRPYTSDDFHPFAEGRSTRGIRVTPQTIGVLKVFVDPKRLAARERAKARNAERGRRDESDVHRGKPGGETHPTALAAVEAGS